MKLLTVEMRSFGEDHCRRLADQAKDALARLHMDTRGVVLVPEPESCGWTVCAGSPFSAETDGPDLFRTLGRVLAEYVLQHLKPALIRKIIRNKYGAYDDEERQRLEQYCLNILQEETEAESEQSRRKQEKEVASRFRTFIERGYRLHLEGFIRFRLRDYGEDLNAVVEYAADEMLVDRQYQEFIAILKYFVGSQEIKRPAVHIYHHQGSEFVVLDEQYRPIDTRSSERFVVETVDKEINLEDMIISTLITVSPRKVYIHTKDPDMQVIRTIRMIFEERAVLCT